MLNAPRLVREARKAAGLTQAELARRLGQPQSVVARLEAPGANPKVDTLKRALAASGHSIEATLGPGPGLDETMIVENLRTDPATRLDRFASAYRSISEMARQARASRGS